MSHAATVAALSLCLRPSPALLVRPPFLLTELVTEVIVLHSCDIEGLMLLFCPLLDSWLRGFCFDIADELFVLDRKLPRMNSQV